MLPAILATKVRKVMWNNAIMRINELSIDDVRTVFVGAEVVLILHHLKKRITTGNYSVVNAASLSNEGVESVMIFWATC